MRWALTATIKMCFRGWKRLIIIKHPSFKGLKRPQHIFPLLYFFPPREISTLLFAELQLNLQKILLAISKKLAKAELERNAYLDCRQTAVLPAGPKNSPPLHSIETAVFICNTSFSMWSALSKLYSVKIKLISYGYLILFLQIIVLLLNILLGVCHGNMMPLLYK